jgi:CHAT domain-containing protein
LTNLGAALALNGDLEKAMEAYQSAYEIQLRLKNQRGQGLTLQKRGEAHALRDEKDQALSDFNRALVAWKAVKDLRGEAATLEDIARVERDRGNLAAAKARSDEAIQIIENLRTDISSRQLRTSYLATRENYFELDIDLKMQDSKPGKSEGVAAALESSERARARGLLDSLSEARIGRVETFQTTDAQLTVLLKQRQTLSDNLSAKAWARTSLLTGSYSRLQLALIEKEIDEITARYEQVETAIRARTPQFSSLIKPKPALLNQIQQQLDNDTLLLEFSLGNERSYVWAVTANSINGIRLPPRAEIDKPAKRIVQALADRKRTVEGESEGQWQRRREQSDKEFNTASAELSDKIIRPLASLLGTKRLVIVADGALQLVSFAALPLPGDTTAEPRRLVDDHEIVYEPSASVLALQRSELAGRKRAPHAVVILADPVFAIDDPRLAAFTERNPSQNVQPKPKGYALTQIATRKGDVSRALEDIGLERFPRLRSSAIEAEKIVDVAPKGESKAALNFDASREAALSRELSQYRIVHFATHAVVNYEHPELSGIVLSLVDRRGQPRDGYLRLHDVYNLHLPADLIVLSACQTGIGKEIKGEGLIALTRGFMYAGAERVVASLWKVDDVATAQLMTEFYKQIFSNGQRPAAALRIAQLKLAKRHSPADWAGFVLQGEWK